MFLKSLTLRGFKSFADTTTLDLEPGVTVVVGPNGSGKSNVVDAVAWVLGAQGPRTVRSSKMDDVIFAGSGKRPALGRAEVSLTIDNSAGLLAVDFTEVTITRTLFRSGDSEYAINGVPCRLLDVQELLSDTGVGRQQHVIVSQGQLASILDARPEERRLVIEEAAGVRKYRRRRERAQRRLDATEANLVRLTDLLREVRRQLRPLERQAEAARRCEALAGEMQALRLYLAGQELAALDAAARASAAARRELDAAITEARGALARLDAEVARAEVAITPTDGDELGEALGRLEGLRERARGLAAVLTERQRSVQREMQAAVDEGVVASLEADAARLARDLEATEEEAAALVPEADRLARAEAGLAAERAALGALGADAPPVLFGRAAELRGELVALTRAAETGRAERAELAERASAVATERAGLDALGQARRAELDEAERATRELAPLAAGAASRRAGADAAAAEAEAAVAATDREQRTWEARAEGLALALEQALGPAREGGTGGGAGGRPELTGVLGHLRDLVEVDEGWELAFEAAAGEALAALVVAGVGPARQALVHLREGDAGRGAAVLALGVGGSPASLGLEAASAVGAEPVRGHVRARDGQVDQLLDGLLATAVAVPGGWEHALDLALAAPGLVVVTMAGDRFASNWWRAGAPATVATRAALAEARAMAESSASAAALAVERLGRATAERDRCRDEESALEARVREAEAAVARSADILRALEARRGALAAEQAAGQARLAELDERLAREDLSIAELWARLPVVEAEEAVEAERVAAAQAARAALEERSSAVRALRSELSVRAAGLEERRGVLARRLAEVEQRLAGHAAARAVAAGRRAGLEQRASACARLAAVVAGDLAVVQSRLVALRHLRQGQASALRAAVAHLEDLRQQRSAAEARVTAGTERGQALELEAAELRLRAEAAAEALRSQLGASPAQAAEAPRPEVPEGSTPEARAAELEQELRLLGPVNPLALSEHTELQERHRFVEGQLEDVRASRRELAKVIKAVDTELTTIFGAAFADVAENFEQLFATLFPGGKGTLRLTDPDNLLETGVEVDARPPGKNVRSLSLLSGGERSLAALAFLFAVFRSRPSPFYLLDEVEAALDDVNLHRFLELLQEFRQEAQLLVVTHQKRTMEIADCLYGVTLQPGGSSRVLSERAAAPA